MQSANLSGPFRGCLYYALLGLPQATGLAGGYDYLKFYVQAFLLTASKYTVLSTASNHSLEVSSPGTSTAR